MKKDYFWNTTGALAQNAISPILLIVITRINGIYESGIFSFAFSVAITFWIMGMWGGRTYQVSDIKNEFSHRSYITTRMVLAVAMIFGAFVFSTLNHYDAMKTELIIVLVLFKAIESIADAIYGVLQVHNRLYNVGKSLLYKAVGSFVAFCLIDISTHNILWSSVVVVLVNIFVMFGYDIFIAGKLENIKVSSSKITHYTKNATVIMKRTAPVLAVTLLMSLSLNIPRYFIDKYHGDEIGYFGIIAMPITLITLVVSFILQPNVVSLSQLYERKKYKEFSTIVNKILGITAVVGIGIVGITFWVGAPLLRLVFGVDFSSYKTALVVMVAGGVVSALVVVYMNILIIVRRFKYFFYVLLLTNLLLFVLSALEIKASGLNGGVDLFAIVSTIQLVLTFIVYKITTGKKISYA